MFLVIYWLTLCPGKEELSEPEPEVVLIPDLKESLKKDVPVESYIYRSSAIGGIATAGNIPALGLESFVNARVLESGIKMARKLDQLEKDKVLLNFKPRGTFAGSIVGEQDDQQTPQLVIDSNETPQDKGSLYPEEELPQTYHNPLYPLNMPTFEIPIDERVQGEISPFRGNLPASESDLSVVGSNSVPTFNHREEEEAEEDDLLNRSLEVPISFIQPTFTQEESLEEITAFLEVTA